MDGSMQRQPPLGALRAFEAAARHLSFTKAAAELFVTQTAVSHQIKTLEEHVGVPLFRRFNRALRLTEEGQTLLPYVSDAMEKIATGLRRLEENVGTGALTVTTTPSFGSSWLAPRLVRFQVRHPEIELQLSTTSRIADFDREDIDCGIRYGMGDWPNLVADFLFHTPLIPVCSPDYLRSGAELREPGDLARHTLLHVLSDLDDWRLWLQAVGVDGVDPTHGPKFDSGPLALQAAINGAGIAIARASLVQRDLDQGRLVTPFDLEVPETYAYYFVASEANANRTKIKAFRDWLMEEVAEIGG
jgi:LysR family glycine cleavage system transcriptional activator